MTVDGMKNGKEGLDERGRSRRAALAGCAAVAAALAGCGSVRESRQESLSQRSLAQKEAVCSRKGAAVVRSACLACNARCGIEAVVQDGKIVEIKGNPFHPYNTLSRPLEYGSVAGRSVPDPPGGRATVCAKAIDSISYVYNPYRILVPLKRAGRRGEGKFEPIGWDQLIREIARGGRLFAHLGEDRVVPGLADLDSDDPIDPEDPYLGPKRNGFVFISGRMQHGRKAFIDRFVKSSFGSINRIGHTDICGLGFRMGNFAFTEGRQVELKADPWSADYILVFGANIYSALQPGVNTYGAAVVSRRAEGRLKFSVVDPRGHEAVAHAERWIRIRPGHDGAFAMGMIRWMIEEGALAHDYLSAPNRRAAARLGNGAYCNAAHLVIAEPGHPEEGRFLRMRHLLASPPKGEEEAFVVFEVGEEGEEGQPVHFEKTVCANYDAQGVVTDAAGRKIRVKTAFKLMKESVFSRSLEEYALLAGVEAGEIAELAREFAAHAPRAAVCQYHGAGNYAGGTYAAYAIAVLNAMVGSVERRGGYMSSGGHACEWRQGIYDLKGFAGKRRPKGIRISREKAYYESSKEFRLKKEATGSGYPAKRPWFPFTKGGLCVETMSGIDQAYPYGCQVLFTYFFNPVYSIPGGYRYQETLADPDKVPLHVSIDVTINESNIYADYIVPDVTFAEGHYGWLPPHAPAQRFTALRTPIIEPLTGATADGRPFCLETFLIDLALELGLPGFGKGALDSSHGPRDLFKAEDFYLRGMVNLAVNAGLPLASGEELALVEGGYPVAKYRDLVTPLEWRRLCTALARGGIFHPYKEQFQGEIFKRAVPRVVLYNEKLASCRNSMTGEAFSGTLVMVEPADSRGNPLRRLDDAYPLALVTHKMAIHTQSRTIWHKIARQIVPENRLMLHPEDAASLGLEDGTEVRVSSRSNPAGLVGRLEISPLLRRGCVAVSHHYGHSQLGASPVLVKEASRVFLGGNAVAHGDRLIPDPTLGSGICCNFVTNLDPNLADTPIVDMVGGIPDFSSTRVRLTPTG